MLSSFVWKRALEEKQKISKADQYGWGMIDRTYKVHLINTQTAPDKSLQSLKSFRILVISLKIEGYIQLKIHNDLMPVVRLIHVGTEMI